MDYFGICTGARAAKSRSFANETNTTFTQSLIRLQPPAEFQKEQGYTETCGEHFLRGKFAIYADGKEITRASGGES